MHETDNIWYFVFNCYIKIVFGCDFQGEGVLTWFYCLGSGPWYSLLAEIKHWILDIWFLMFQNVNIFFFDWFICTVNELNDSSFYFFLIYWKGLFHTSSSSGKNHIHYIIYWVYHNCDIVLCWLCKDTFVCYTDKWTAFKAWSGLLALTRKKE